MKNVFLITVAVIGFIVTSCQKEIECNCTQTYDSSVTYVEDDMVTYDGQCWRASAQGRGIEPGPWMQNGNDIWEECISN